MTSTVYSHTYSENAKTGVYKFDCVGSVDYFLKLGSRNAWSAMHSQLKIRPGYVPKPPRLLNYITNTHSQYWQDIKSPAAIRPGDIIAMDAITNPDDSTPGHAMIAASWPLLLSNGTYALTVYDSTGSPHGAEDSRRWDHRTTPLSSKTTSGASTSNTSADTGPVGSGLGFGTIQIWPASASKLTPPREQMSWTVGTKPIKTQIAIGRASN